jgi:hypothetical protein
MTTVDAVERVDVRVKSVTSASSLPSSLPITYMLLALSRTPRAAEAPNAALSTTCN